MPNSQEWPLINTCMLAHIPTQCQCVHTASTGPSIPVQRMQGGRGAVCRTLGHLTDTEDVDCDVCKCDLFLSAVVAPGSRRATCPEHAAAHNDALSEAVFLQRYSLEELDAMVADAVTLVPGAQAAIDDAQQRKAKLAVRGSIYREESWLVVVLQQVA